MPRLSQVSSHCPTAFAKEQTKNCLKTTPTVSIILDPTAAGGESLPAPSDPDNPFGVQEF